MFLSSIFNLIKDSHLSSFWLPRWDFVIFSLLLLRYYSVLRATTGSFFAALRAGITPEMDVRAILSMMSITA